MATPDIQNLFERFVQIYGGQGASTEPSRSEPRYQLPQPASVPAGAYTSDDGRAPTGGVLREWGSQSPAVPWWGRALAGSGGMPVGLRGPRSIGPNGNLPPFPMPVDPKDVVEIPNPHLEKFIPQSTLDFWNALTLLPQMLRGQLLGDERWNGNNEGEKGASSTGSPPEPPANRPGGQPPWIVGPAVLKEEFERQGKVGDQRPRPKEIVDPNVRRLTRFVGSEGDQIVSDNLVQPSGEDTPGKSPPTPLPDHHLDIPQFLRRQPEPESAKAEKKWTDLPPSNFRGGGNYGGNRGGGGGGGRKSDEECRKEERQAKKICIDAFENGTFGDMVKRWKSNYATGPFPKPDNEPWTIDDCKKGFISEACGGNEYERAPPPAVTKNIGRRLVKQKNDKRAARKAKEKEIREIWKRTGKWTLGR